MYRARATVIVVALVVLGGCASTTFVYNRLDFILPWYLDDYVELNREQDQFLEQQLAPFLAWHRSEELTSYLVILDQIEDTLGGEVSADDIATLSMELEMAWFRLEERALDWLVALGEQLSDQQLGQFTSELWKQQEKYEQKYLQRSDEEYRGDSYESLLDNTQDYLGRLNKSQRRILRDASAELRRSDAIWLQERAAWLRKLEGYLRREEGWQLRLRESLASRGETMSDQYRELVDHNLAVIHRALAQVLNSRTESQDRRLRKKLADLREDLETLIAQGRPEAA